MPATVAHCETVLRHFYGFHLESGSGPLVNPFPLDRGRGGRSGAHHNPMEPFRDRRSGLFRPRVAQHVPRGIPDEQFSELFARLGSHRDRALAAFWVSTGRGPRSCWAPPPGTLMPGRQLITVIRKGTRAMQQLPASPDAFVWLRLYQEQMRGLVPAGPDQPLWWTLRRPFRQLSYHAALRMIARASEVLGAGWTLHDLRHTAAGRMARDPEMPLADMQWILGHARLSTTQLYLKPVPEDVIAWVVAFHARRARPAPPGPRGPGGYRPDTLKILFGTACDQRPGGAGSSLMFTAALRGPPRRTAGSDAAVPSRGSAGWWPGTGRGRDRRRASDAAPFGWAAGAASGCGPQPGAMLDWLDRQPGSTWQERWSASGAEGTARWPKSPPSGLRSRQARASDRHGHGLGAGLLLLICGELIRPGPGWLLAAPGCSC